MRKILFLLFLLPLLAQAQSTFTAPVGYNTGAPTGAPSGLGTRIRFDLLTNKIYTWSPVGLNWQLQGQTIDQIAGTSAPAYTPIQGQSTFTVNGDNPPKLYQYSGSGTTWLCLNCASGSTYTAGTGIAISDSNVISNTGDLSPTNELQNLSLSGSDLSLSNGGGTVTLPGGGIYGGSNYVPSGTVASLLGGFDIGYSANSNLHLDQFGYQLTAINPSHYSSISSTQDGDIAMYCDGNFDFNNGNDLRYVQSEGYQNPNERNIYIFKDDAGSGVPAIYIRNKNSDGFTYIDNSFDGRYIINDNSTSHAGLEYAADYSETIKTHPLSIPDVGTVVELIAEQVKSGYTTGTTDGSGNLVITHGFGATPTTVVATYEGVQPNTLIITAKTSTTFTVKMWSMLDDNWKASTSLGVNWICK